MNISPQNSHVRHTQRYSAYHRSDNHLGRVLRTIFRPISISTNSVTAPNCKHPSKNSLDEVVGEDNDGVPAGGDGVDDVVDDGLANHEVSLVDA